MEIVVRSFYGECSGVSEDLIGKEKYDKIIAERALYAKNTMYSKLNQTDLELSDYLLVEEQKMLNKLKSLKRSI